MIDLTGLTTVADVPRVQSELRGEAAGFSRAARRPFGKSMRSPRASPTA